MRVKQALHACLASLFLLTALTACVTSDPNPARALDPRDNTLEWLYSESDDPMLQTSTDPRNSPPPVILEGEEKDTLIYTCRHTRSEVIRDAVEGFVSPEGTVRASSTLNTLMIAESKKELVNLLKMVEAIDRPVPQVLVEAKIVEVTLDSDFEYELEHVYKELTTYGKEVVRDASVVLDTPGSSPNSSLGSMVTIRPWASGSAQLENFIRLLVTKGRARILSSPNLMVALDSEGSLITGEEQPIQSATVVSGSVSTTTVFKSVGIKLRVMPTLITGDTATMEINPEVSTVTGYTTAGESGVSNPIVAVRNVRTQLSIKDGEILTIGGLLRDENREVTRKVPFLGDIPILGLLFQSQRDEKVKTQLVFFLRIRILPEGVVDATRAHRPGMGIPEPARSGEPATPGSASTGENR